MDRALFSNAVMRLRLPVYYTSFLPEFPPLFPIGAYQSGISVILPEKPWHRGICNDGRIIHHPLLQFPANPGTPQNGTGRHSCHAP